MTVYPECLLRRAAQPSPPTSSPLPFPISASTQRPLRLSVIFDPSRRRPFVIPLRTLRRSCRSFCDSHPLFSMISALFDKNTGGGIPPRLQASQVTSHESPASSCAETQKRPAVSPLPATLTQTPGMGVPRLPRFSPAWPILNFALPFLFMILQIPFPASPLF